MDLGGFDPAAPGAAGQYDDAVALGVAPGELKPESRLILDNKLTSGGHDLPENLLRARIRGFLASHESFDPELGRVLDFYVGTYTADGHWIYCSSNQDAYIPRSYRIDYAQKVCKHVNRAYSMGGAWLAGWIRGGRVFYLCWKDSGGDIKVPIEADRPFIVLRHWRPEDWEKHCVAALGMLSEWERNLELSKSQQKSVAAGEQVSRGHGEFLMPTL